MAAYTGDYTPEEGSRQRIQDLCKSKGQSRRRHVEHRFSAVAGNLKGAVDSSIEEQPMVTLAVAVGIGFTWSPLENLRVGTRSLTPRRWCL
jgi:hypothetical protein